MSNDLPPHVIKLHSADEAAETFVRGLIEIYDPEPDRPGLKETPKRVAKALEFWTKGYHEDPKSVLKEFEDGAEDYDEMVTVRDIPVYSLCEHHLTPFFGVAHIGYIPNGKIVGLSKFARLTEIFARRFQVQERLTRQIADAISDQLNPLAVGVVIRCRHMCIESRGVEKHGVITYTSALIGGFKDHGPARDEFLRFIAAANEKSF